MRKGRISSVFYLCLILCLLNLAACVSKSVIEMPVIEMPVIEMPEPYPPIVKSYTRFTLYGNVPGLQKTGVRLNEGDVFSVLATGTIDVWPSRPGYRQEPANGFFYGKIGRISGLFHPSSLSKGSIHKSAHSGELLLGIRDGPVDYQGIPKKPESYQDNTGFFDVDIIVWKSQDYVQIGEFLEAIKANDPQNKAIADVLETVKIYRDIQLASAKIEETKSKIEALKEERAKEEQKPKVPEMETKTGAEGKPGMPEEKQSGPSALDGKLAKLNETLFQLEELKRQLQQEKEKTDLLSQQLEEREKKEKDLMVKLERGSKGPPVIMIASPADESKMETKVIHLSGLVQDDQGLVKVEIFLNNKPLKQDGGRGLKITGEGDTKRLQFNEQIPIEGEVNKLKILALNSEGFSSERTLTVHYVERRKNIWAVIIGVNGYPNVRHLKYAVNDARAFHDYLVKYSHTPAENVMMLLDKEATLTKIKSTLGTHLKERAGKDDMVIIFFAGHGATEKDVESPDGDGLEKYLLPFDAEPRDLYATALPMSEISKIFSRIRSERLIFIADSCYSGASGGRTIGISGIRANISDAFLDRLSGGKGRMILTASGANEVSTEKDELKHGVFTYHFIEGLKGKADADKDGIITVDEIYAYVSEKVPRATGQEQHPVKKGTFEGRLIIGVLNRVPEH